MFRLALGLFISLRLFAYPAPELISVPVGLSETRTIENVRKVSVADGRIAKVRAVPPNQLLIVGLKVGRTQIRTWTERGEGPSFFVEVLSSSFPSNSSAGVIRVSLELYDLSSGWSRDWGTRLPDAIQASGSAHLSGDSAMSGLNYAFSATSTQAFLKALIRDGKARRRAHPSLAVRLGEEAVFHSGGEFPVPTSLDSFGRLQRYVDWKRYGTSVKVRPQSLDRYFIQSDIDIEISEPDAGLGREGLPALTRRQLNTKMNSRDGETVILSGLIRELSSETQEGTPLLSHLPILGPVLFSEQRKSDERNEVLMAVTLAFATQSRENKRLEDFQERWDSHDLK